jgi:structural maintenance of chromosome 4
VCGDPAGVKRLYDLVKIRDEALRCAFFYALRDSLVVNDLEQASRIANSGNRRWAKVVTLQVHTISSPAWATTSLTAQPSCPAKPNQRNTH